MRRLATAVTVLLLSLSVRADITGVTSREILVPSSQAIPEFMVVGPDENVWFTDIAHKLVGKMRISGGSATVTTYPLTGALPAGQAAVDVMGGITVGPDGALWFTFRGCANSACSGTRQQNLGRITTDGSLSAVALQGVPNPGLAGSPPSSIVSGPDGNFWMAYGGAPAPLNILRVTPSGAVTPLNPPRNDAFTVALGPDQNIWYLGRAVVGKVTTSGAFTEFPLPSGARGSGNLAFDRDGNAWFPTGSRTVTKMTPSGSFTSFTTPSQESPNWVLPFADGTIWYTLDFGPGTIGRITPAGTVEEQRLPGSGGRGKQLLRLPQSTRATLVMDPYESLLRNGSDQSLGTALTRIDVPGAAVGLPDLTIEVTHHIYPTLVDYDVRIKNVGAGPTQGAFTVKDTLPGDVVFAHASDVKADCNFEAFTKTITCTFDPNDGLVAKRGPLPPGGELLVKITCDLNGPLTHAIENQATVSGGGDLNTANNVSDLDRFDPAGPDLVPVIYHSFDAQKNVNVTMEVTNVGRQPTVTPVTLTLDLPPQATLLTLQPTVGGTCAAAGPTITCQSNSPILNSDVFRSLLTIQPPVTFLKLRMSFNERPSISTDLVLGRTSAPMTVNEIRATFGRAK